MNIRFFLSWVKKIGSSLLIIISGVCVEGQSIQQGIEFSDQDLPGDARSKAIGGVNSTLAGVASISTNPSTSVLGGKSQFLFTPNIITRKNLVNYAGQETDQMHRTFKLASFGILIHSNSVTDAVSDNIGMEKTESAVPPKKPMTFGVAYNRTNNFNNSYSFNGLNEDHSITDYFGQLANKISLRNQVVDLPSIYSPAELAFLTYLVDPDSVGIYSIGAGAGGNVTQQFDYDRRGGFSSLDFSFAIGLNKKLALGITGGFRLYNFNYETEFLEEDTADVHLYYQRAIFKESFEANGAGGQIKLGATYQPSSNLSVSFAYHLPSGMIINRKYSSSMFGRFVDHPELTEDTVPFGNGSVEDLRAQTTELAASYKVVNPGRTTVGLVYKAKKLGLITGELECVNHSSVRFENISTRDLNVNYSEVNDGLDQFWKLNLNLRLGGEFHFKSLRFRGGAAVHNLLPTNNDLAMIPTNLRRNYLTFGIGIQKPTFFFDLAVVRQFSNTMFRPYSIDGFSDVGTRAISGTDIVIGTGVSF